MLNIHTILHPTDFSTHSERAFQLACSLARDSAARLIVLHVREQPVVAYTGVMMAPPPAPLPDDERQAANERLLRIRAPSDSIQIEHRFLEGDASAAILQVAEEAKCDLIVMGTHGRTGLSRVLMGSIAEKVLRGALCPVLTVKEPVAK